MNEKGMHGLNWEKIIIGTKAVYSPTWMGRPAMVAYASGFGITAAATVRPAMRSSLSHAVV
jgi:hypothetical protein